MSRHFLLFLIIVFALPIHAENEDLVINFETKDYASVGVYDLWHDSPFNKGLLKGNCAVVDNPDVNDKNRSKKVLACQRSLYGSNLYGARIDLLPEQYFRLTPMTKYVHIMMQKPIPGRALLIALGHHTSEEWKHQSKETVQATSLNSFQPGSNTWSESIYPLQGYEDIEICSLVIVFDCESPHRLEAPFIAYLDGITINDSSKARYVMDDYALSFNAAQVAASSEPFDVEVDVDGNTTQILSDPTESHHVYNDCTTTIISARPGDVVTSTVYFNGEGLNAYIFLDRNGDGCFQASADAQGFPAPASDLMTHSYYWGYNAAGESIGQSSLQPPPFVVPSDLPSGFYRLRFKLDRNNLEAAGGPNILQWGGRITDCLMHIQADDASHFLYDLQGRRVTNPSPGIYIRNKRKQLMLRHD